MNKIIDLLGIECLLILRKVLNGKDFPTPQTVFQVVILAILPEPSEKMDFESPLQLRWTPQVLA